MKDKKIVIGLLLGTILLMAIGYAAFATNIIINGTANIESNWKVVFTNIDIVSQSDGVIIKNTATASGTTATFDVGLTSPGDSIKYRITVANQGSIDAVIESINASETGNDAILFEITNIKTGDILLKNATTTFDVKISYNDDVTSQPEKIENKLTVEINYVQNVGQEITPSEPNIENTSGVTLATKLAKEIKSAKSDVNINFGEVGNGNGMYYSSSQELIENGELVYYYRGAVDNNYVKMGTRTTNTCTYNGNDVVYLDFYNWEIEYNLTEEKCTTANICVSELLGIYATGIDNETCATYGGIMLDEKATYTENVTEDILWRIVRINEDGSIRLVTEKAVGVSAFNNQSNDNAYVGYMYGTPGSSTYELTHENKTSSSIKTYLDNWYTANLSSYSKLMSHEAGFCNAKGLGASDISNGKGIGTVATEYIGGWRYSLSTLWEGAALGCSNGDLFTTGSSSKGNKKLTNPIGLLTVDELVAAGAVYNEMNLDYYLSNGTVYLTMTPQAYDGNANLYYSFAGGVIDWIRSDIPLGVRPVVNIISNAEVLDNGADGTLNKPYIIKN